eukprot:CAMPEP_0172527556 /NCGR_PEP_ID=MMETSP1067-20121228/2201_1 /TAXON_ID=265564 ORGANISM="Thalassiosira punctigera, Strain Tpunct2005C2" /NCGR_SAMPLE_ID=MMETSP1067 /ASSEMBLY_ACC=CAM_ASM_000444 /LENGTH=3313 /DNA_ID=CAMNT_0013311309 /DNA_START=123 /DNA_END=10064 /DNA_ORIENTATION=-
MSLQEQTPEHRKNRALLLKVKEAKTLGGCIDKAFDVYGTRQLFGSGTSQIDINDATVYQWTTYSEASVMCRHLSRGLQSALPVGSSVALCSLQATADHYLCAISAVRAGMVCVSVSPTMGDPEIIHILQKSNAAAIICQPALLSRLEQLCPDCPNLRFLLPNTVTQIQLSQGALGRQLGCPEVLTSWRRMPLQDLVDGKYSTDDLAACPMPKTGESLFGLIFTSGSTGMPKGVYISAERWLTETFIPGPRNVPVDVCAFTQPAWFMSQWTIWRCFFNGGKIGFSTASERLFADMRGINPTIVFAPPAVWAPVAKSYHLEAKAIDGLSRDQKAMAMEELKDKYRQMVGTRAYSVSVGSAMVPASVMDFLHDVFDTSSKVYDGYGTTEFGHLLKDGKICQRNVEVKVVDVPDLGYSAEDLPHPRGELLVRSPLMIAEYVRSEEESIAAWDEDGWYRTGDIVEQLSPDQFKFVDRRKSFFKLADGTFCAAASIEGALMYCPSVYQIFVCAVPQLCAAVVPREHLREKVYSDKEVVEKMILSEFKAVGNERGLEPNMIPHVVVLDRDPWDPHNGLLGLSLKPVRPALMRKYEQIMLKKVQDIFDSEPAVCELNWTVDSTDLASLSLLLPLLRQEIFRMDGAVAGGFFAIQNLAISPRPRNSSNMKLRISRSANKLTVEQTSSQHDPWGEILRADLETNHSSNQVDIQEEMIDAHAMKLSDLNILKVLLDFHESNLNIVSLGRSCRNNLLLRLKVTNCNHEALLVAAGFALANSLGDAAAAAAADVLEVGQLFIHSSLEDKDEFQICAFFNGSSPSFVIYSVQDWVQVIAMEDIKFEDSSEKTGTHEVPHEHFYELLWQETSSTDELESRSRCLTLVTGDGPRAHEVAVQMQMHLGKRLCTVRPDLPQKLSTDVMILTFLDENDTMRGLEIGLQISQTISQSDKIVWFVTPGTQRPIASNLEHGGLWGIARSARAEYPQNLFAIVDVDAKLPACDLAVSLVEETQVADVTPEVVLARGARLVPYFYRPSHHVFKHVDLDQSGVYIITGGTGSLGLLTARRLVEIGAMKVALLSRTSRIRDDAKDAWEWLQRSPAQVVVHGCDVTDVDACKRTLLVISKELGGAIRGIIHAAGRADAAPMARYSKELMKRTSFAKVVGALNLHEISLELQLELQFFVLYSSVSAILSPAAAGAIGYSAANSMLDTLAHFRRSRGLPCVSIQWGAWSEAGLAARHHGVVGRLYCRGIQSVSSELGVAGLHKVLGALTSQVMFTPMDWEVLAKNQNPLQAPFLDFTSDKPMKAWSREEIQSEVEAAVRKVATIGDSELVNPCMSVMDMGLHSLGTTELSQSLESCFGLELSSTFVFTNPTVADMTRHILERLEIPDAAIPEEQDFENKNSSPSKVQDEIMVTGMSCRFPGSVTSPRQLWELSCAGRLTSSGIPFDRWDASSLAVESDLGETGKQQASHGSFVHDAEFFDPTAFHISEVEAESMSPSQRMLLECSFSALLDAGYTADSMMGLNCGVFVAITSNSLSTRRPSNCGVQSKSSVYNATGTAPSIASGRISYVFNFQGPNVVYDTACSSSLVALDAALSALREGKCEMALVAGVNTLFDSEVFEAFARAGMLSPSGQCHTWDASADGYLRGEGCGAVLLKPANLVKPGSAYASVLGASIMSDGKSASITAPNGAAQEKLIRRALDVSGIKAEDVDYIEAHGTGTVLGDPIEIEALAEVFAHSRSSSQPLFVGSVKSNIGHLEGAAGMASLIKAVLVLTHECAPPNASLETLNPLIDKIMVSHNFDVKFPTKVESVTHEESGKLLVAGVSSFGYSGTIAHTIIRQVPANVRRAVDWNVKRSNRGILFLFTGQGSQYAGMGKQLYNESEAFRAAMDECERIYMALAGGVSLLDMIFDLDSVGQLTANAQPALIALEWSIARMWQSADVTPNIVLGHSVGEIAAACVAGAMSIDSALKLAVARARLMHQLPNNDGTMIAVKCTAKEAEAAMSSCLTVEEQDLLGVASVNGPESIVLSGASDVVEKVLSVLGKKGICLQVSHAFHSPLMRGMQERFRVVVNSLDIHKPLITPIASTVSGSLVQAGEFIEPEHWVKQLTSPVLFEDAFVDGMEYLGSASTAIIVEVGPKPVLSNLAKVWWKSKSLQVDPLWVASLDQGKHFNLEEFPLNAGAPLNAGPEVRDADHFRTIFPNRKRIPWPESPPHPLLQQSTPIGSRGNEFRAIFHDKLMGVFGDHMIEGKSYFPASGYIEMGIAAGALMVSGSNDIVKLHDVKFSHRFGVNRNSELVATHYTEGGMEFSSNSSASQHLASIARIQAAVSSSLSLHSLDILKSNHTNQVRKPEDCQLHLTEVLAPCCHTAHRSIRSVHLDVEGKSALGLIDLPEDCKHKDDFYYHIHPLVLNAAIQIVNTVAELGDGAVWSTDEVSLVELYRPRELHKGQQMWVHVTIYHQSLQTKTCDMSLYDENGPLISLQGVRYARIGCQELDMPLYTARWVSSSIESKPLTSETLSKGMEGISDITWVHLNGCPPLNAILSDQICVSVATLSDIKLLPANDLPAVTIVPLMFKPNECGDSTALLEECVSLLQTLAAALHGGGDGLSRQICFWTQNAEGPWTNGIVEGTTDESMKLLEGSIWGMVRSASLEIDPHKLRMICVDTDMLCAGAIDCLGQVMDELNCHDSRQPDVEVVYRGNTRYVRRLQVSQQEDQVASNGAKIGVTLITGGLGGLGLVTAEALVEMGANHVVLASRSGAVKHSSQGLEDRLEKLLGHDNGERVSIECCDMSKEDQVQSLLHRIRQKHRCINTIIHASGVISDCRLRDLDSESIRTHFQPKAFGAWYLHKLTTGDDIRHFVTYSSISALIGSSRLLGYAGANSYLDSLVRLRCHQNLPTRSIQWPAIADVGMASVMDSLNIPSSEKLSLPNMKMVLKEVFHCNANGSDVSISPIPSTVLHKACLIPRLGPMMTDIMRENGHITLPRRDYVAARCASKGPSLKKIKSEVEAAVRKVASVLSTDTIDERSLLVDLGVDSLGTTELFQSLQATFKIELPLAFAFNNPSVADMSDQLFHLLSSGNAIEGCDTTTIGEAVVGPHMSFDVSSCAHASSPVTILGSGGHVRTLIMTLNDLGMPIRGVYTNLSQHVGQQILGIPVRGLLDQIPNDLDAIIVAVGDWKMRRQWVQEQRKRQPGKVNLFPTICHPSAQIHSSAIVGEGCFIGPSVVVDAEASIGMHTIISAGSVIGHNSAVGSFSLLGGNSTLAGAARVGDDTEMGVSASIAPKVRVGNRVKVGAGSAVMHTVGDSSTVVGVPAQVTYRMA